MKHSLYIIYDARCDFLHRQLLITFIKYTKKLIHCNKNKFKFEHFQTDLNSTSKKAPIITFIQLIQ